MQRIQSLLSSSFTVKDFDNIVQAFYEGDNDTVNSPKNKGRKKLVNNNEFIREQKLKQS